MIRFQKLSKSNLLRRITEICRFESYGKPRRKSFFSDTYPSHPIPTLVIYLFLLQRGSRNLAVIFLLRLNKYVFISLILCTLHWIRMQCRLWIECLSTGLYQSSSTSDLRWNHGMKSVVEDILLEYWVRLSCRNLQRQKQNLEPRRESRTLVKTLTLSKTF